MSRATAQITNYNYKITSYSVHEPPDKFNIFFIEKIATPRSTISSNPPAFGTQSNSSLIPFPSGLLSDFHIVTKQELSSLIVKPPTKSDIMDLFPYISALRHIFLLSYQSLQHLISLSPSNGMLQMYQHAVVCPLLKKKDMNPEVISNFRYR
jgi:hypothetical protein